MCQSGLSVRTIQPQFPFLQRIERRPRSPCHCARCLRRRAAARAVALASFVLFAGFARVAGADTQVGGALPPPPDKLYGDLFVAVQTAQIYPDQKTFVDALPKADPTTILQAYDAQKNQSNFSLKTFVDQYFTPPSEPVITPLPNQSLRDHINWLWPELTRITTSAPPYSSLIPMPKPYVVPGGRFREGYYWTRTSRCWACRSRDMKISSTTCSTTSRT